MRLYGQRKTPGPEAEGKGRPVVRRLGGSVFGRDPTPVESFRAWLETRRQRRMDKEMDDFLRAYWRRKDAGR